MVDPDKGKLEFAEDALVDAIQNQQAAALRRVDPYISVMREGMIVDQTQLFGHRALSNLSSVCDHYHMPAPPTRQGNRQDDTLLRGQVLETELVADRQHVRRGAKVRDRDARQTERRHQKG